MQKADYKSKLEKKDPCKYCKGPPGECTEIRGGFLPNWVCKTRPTYDQLWDMYNGMKEEYQNYSKLQHQYDDLVEELERLRDLSTIVKENLDKLPD